VQTFAFTLQQVGAKGAPGAPDPGAAPGGSGAQASPPGGGLMFFLPLIMLVPFLFLSFRRQKKEQEARGKLKKGDRIVSQSGLVGELIDLDEKFAKVKIAPGTTVTMTIAGISPLAPEPSKADDKLKDLKDAKVTAEKK
jgi:preprotein translocase subunit YajC